MNDGNYGSVSVIGAGLLSILATISFSRWTLLQGCLACVIPLMFPFTEAAEDSCQHFCMFKELKTLFQRRSLFTVQRCRSHLYTRSRHNAL
jgi:hypothetical protein